MRRPGPAIVTAMGWAVAVAGPPVLTVALVHVGGAQTRDYVFLYLALVAVLGVLRGMWPALVAAAVSFLLVDLFFVPPTGTLTIADEQDVVNLLAFAATAAGVGLVGSQRRRALLQSEALAQDLRQVNTELARLNKEQAAAAQAALAVARSQEQVRALQEVDQARRDLLANVSHELRTPLATILTESTSPLADVQSPEELERRLRAVAGEARRLEALVDDMLDLAVIETGALELRLEPVRLADALEAAVERLHRISPRRGVDWEEAAAELDVLADWSRLLQILDNLLANADRFGAPDTPIEIGVEPDGGGRVTVRVRDHGPGVPPEMRGRLFQRFARGPSQNGRDGQEGVAPQAQQAGTGLGLAIVKGLVEAHAGSVAMEDAPGGGACFRFTLPPAAPEPAQEEE